MATDLTNLAIMGLPGGYHRIAMGEVSIGTAGSATDMDTGLNTIVEAVASVKGTVGGTENTLCLTVDFDTDDGLVDIYCFDVAGTAATTDTVTVMVMAIGQ